MRSVEDPADETVTGPLGDIGPLDERQRRRRRFFVGGIVAGAAVVAVAMCAGLLAVVSGIDGMRDRAGR